jgi:hypothetical protein
VANLVIRFVAAKGNVDFDEDDLRHAQAEGAGDFSSDQLGHQGQRALAGTAEFSDIETQIVRLDDGGQRPAFAEGQDIAGSMGRSQHGILSVSVGAQPHRRGALRHLIPEHWIETGRRS